ncbi:MAG: hypothetical protein Alpg2KO_23070 [Alphaproteobacteria bacterium]
MRPWRAAEILLDERYDNYHILRRLPMETRVRLLEEVTRPVTKMAFWSQTKMDTARLRAYDALKTENVYTTDDHQRMTRLGRHVNGDRLLMHARNNWTRMGNREKLRMIDRYARLMAREWGVKPQPIKLFVQAPNADGTVRMAVYDHDDGEIGLNWHPQACRASFDRAIGAVTHEQMHAFQQIRIDQFYDGKVFKSLREELQVRLMKANYEDLGYIPPERYGPGIYRMQPIERQAFLAQEAITRMLRSPQAHLPHSMLSSAERRPITGPVTQTRLTDLKSAQP